MGKRYKRYCLVLYQHDVFEIVIEKRFTILHTGIYDLFPFICDVEMFLKEGVTVRSMCME